MPDVTDQLRVYGRALESSSSAFDTASLMGRSGSTPRDVARTSRWRVLVAVAMAVVIVGIVVLTVARRNSGIVELDGHLATTATASSVGTALGTDGRSAPGTPVTGTSSRPLSNRRFVSTSVTESGAARSLLPGTRLFIDFHEDSLRADAGCNALTGSWRDSGGHIEMGPGWVVEAQSCSPLASAQDKWFADLMVSGPTFSLAGSNLVLTTPHARIELSERGSLERPLEDTSWRLEALGVVGHTEPLPTGVDRRVHLVLVTGFSGTRHIRAFLDCTILDATYRKDGSMITIQDAYTTDPCRDGRSEFEARVLAVLGDGTTQWAISGPLLTLCRDGDCLTYAPTRG